jgi:hypothetical protein
MPRAAHRLDIVLVPDDPDRTVDSAELRSLAAAWQGRADLVEGGVGAIRADVPCRVTLYGNQLGGFAVRCPDLSQNVVPAFNRAMTAWRAGGARVLPCTACGADHPLEALDYAPPAAFAAGAIVLADVNTRSPNAVALTEAAAVLGPVRLILRRVG